MLEPQSFWGEAEHGQSAELMVTSLFLKASHERNTQSMHGGF